MANTKLNYKKIFISWSGDNSKEIAKALKEMLEDHIFQGQGLECFVSDIDISSGDDWWNKIKSELKKCKLGIACITKENKAAPWIYFESGAMIARELKLIPLLINCNYQVLNDTPLSSKHMVDFYSEEKFWGMIKTINNELKLSEIPDENLETIAKSQYRNLIITLTPILKKLKNLRVFNEQFIYPKRIKSVNLNTLYISAPMSSIEKDEYIILRNFLLQLRPKLQALGFTKVISPIFDKDDYDNFDGNTKAIRENFKELKQVDSMMVIYPHAYPSSVLVEIGYGLALCKKTVIFYKEGLPYILKDAGQSISHIDTRLYKEYEDIERIIISNGKQLFKIDEEE